MNENATETTVIYARGDEEWEYAWGLAGERYSPLHKRVAAVRTTWEVRDLLSQECKETWEYAVEAGEA